MLPLFVLLLVLPVVLVHVFVEQVTLLFFNLVQLCLESLNCLLQTLLILLQLFRSLFRLLALLLRALDEHIDVLEYLIFRSNRLNPLVLLISDQVLLVHLFLQLTHLSLKLLVLSLDLDKLHLGLTCLALHDLVRRVNTSILLVIVNNKCFHVEALVHRFKLATFLLPLERVVRVISHHHILVRQMLSEASVKVF